MFSLRVHERTSNFNAFITWCFTTREKSTPRTLWQFSHTWMKFRANSGEPIGEKWKTRKKNGEETERGGECWPVRETLRVEPERDSECSDTGKHKGSYLTPRQDRDWCDDESPAQLGQSYHKGRACESREIKETNWNKERCGKTRLSGDWLTNQPTNTKSVCWKFMRLEWSRNKLIL